nr:MAG: ORF1 [TTV-like mini virus]
MPPFYRKRWYRYNYKRRRNPYRKQRFWFRLRRGRFRRTVQRRRKARVRKLFKYSKKKKRTLKLLQWQPELIRKCYIKGLFTLFACNKGRGANNYPQYRDSFVPQYQPGGGGWGIYVFNLGALFDEFLRIRNYWTATNIDKPLCRYLYCKLKFYRTDNVDYVVHYSRSYPMTDDEFKHADACPSRMLMRQHKIIVQSRQHTHKKPYVIRKIRPPRQITNKWFFQREFINTNLLMLTVTACSLTKIDIPPTAISNNISLISLNYRKFRSLNYQRQHTTQPYQPTNGTYLYGIEQHNVNFNANNPLQNVKYGMLTFLGQATRMTEGTSFNDSSQTTWDQYVTSPNISEWGNVFTSEYIHSEKVILQSNIQPTGLKEATTAKKDTPIDTSQFTIMTEDMFIHCRYNPDKDTGKNTKIYFVPNFQDYNDWKEPDNPQLKFHGFPLWMLLWGWPDWQKKLGLINQIDQHYALVIESEAFEPKEPKYMFLDPQFLDNTLEFYDKSDTTLPHKPFLHDQQNWYPKFWYQQESIDKICMSGPATHKFINEQSIQTHMKYMFAFKWGGTSTTMETIADPAKQPMYPTTGNILSGIQIQDPATDPRDLIYPFDFRRHTLTQKATKRLTEPRPDEPISTISDPWNPVPYIREKENILQTLIETQTKKETKEETIKQFLLLRERQQLLNQRIQQFIIQNTKL